MEWGEREGRQEWRWKGDNCCAPAAGDDNENAPYGSVTLISRRSCGGHVAGFVVRSQPPPSIIFIIIIDVIARLCSSLSFPFFAKHMHASRVQCLSMQSENSRCEKQEVGCGLLFAGAGGFSFPSLPVYVVLCGPVLHNSHQIVSAFSAFFYATSNSHLS